MALGLCMRLPPTVNLSPHPVYRKYPNIITNKIYTTYVNSGATNPLNLSACPKNFCCHTNDLVVLKVIMYY